MTGFGDTGEDIVFLIVDTIRASTTRHQFLRDLRSLSLTSHSLRQICLPIIFRTFKRSWSLLLTKQNEVLPRSLCGHVTTFELDMSTMTELSDGGALAGLADKLAVVFPRMSVLHTFRFVNSLECGPWPDLLRAIFSAPALQSLEIYNSPWRKPVEVLPGSIYLPRRSLRKFVYRVPFVNCFPLNSEAYGRRDAVQGPVETSNLITLISLISGSLEILELPAELAPPLTEIPYPNLREFIVQGHVPSRPSDWMKIFQSAPRLRDARFQIVENRSRRSKNENNHEKHCIHPRTLTAGCYSLPDLRSLTISTPWANDLIFNSLPDSLTSLNLTSFPLPGILGARWSEVVPEVPTSSDMLNILRIMHLPNVLGLAISYCADEADVSMISQLSVSFPTLKTLEFHRYRPLARKNEDFDPMPLMLEAFTRFPFLQDLRLNLDYPERPRYRSWRESNTRRYREFHTFLENKVARKLAESIPSLRSVSVLFHDDFSSYWDTWDIDTQSDDSRLVPLVDSGTRIIRL